MFKVGDMVKTSRDTDRRSLAHHCRGKIGIVVDVEPLRALVSFADVQGSPFWWWIDALGLAPNGLERAIAKCSK